MSEALAFAVRGRVDRLSPTDRRVLFDRTTSGDAAIRARTAEIVRRVRTDGDRALRTFAREFDGTVAGSLEVPRDAWDAALATLDPALRDALERAAANIRVAHEAFRPIARQVVTADGVVIGRRPDPLGRVGVYAPGGRAAYASSLLMGAVPARVAGVGEVIVCSPPTTEGRPAPVLLAAAALANVDRVFAVGGAGAVAAMAFGTETVPRVDRIVGPGNAYVAEAKLQVANVVGIDVAAGPSELLVLADDSASPTALAREMLAQAEHDPMAAVVAVVASDTMADALVAALERRVDAEPRAATIRAAFAARGAVLVAASPDDAIAFANAWAPEHVLLALRPARCEAVLAQLRHAGTVFIGESASVAFGDYLTGANHVLPTGGLARMQSGLSTADFVRWTTWQRIDRTAARRLAFDVGLLADAEGLPAHAAAARQWENA